MRGLLFFKVVATTNVTAPFRDCGTLKGEKKPKRTNRRTLQGTELGRIQSTVKWKVVKIEQFRTLPASGKTPVRAHQQKFSEGG